MTLVTCTPYAVNTHRLLVRGRRVEYTGEEKSKTVSQLQPAAMARRLVDVWPWFLFMMAGGHVLIEDIPGVGKTSMALSLPMRSTVLPPRPSPPFWKSWKRAR